MDGWMDGCLLDSSSRHCTCTVWRRLELHLLLFTYLRVSVFMCTPHTTCCRYIAIAHTSEDWNHVKPVFESCLLQVTRLCLYVHSISSDSVLVFSLSVHGVCVCAAAGLAWWPAR